MIGTAAVPAGLTGTLVANARSAFERPLGSEEQAAVARIILDWFGVTLAGFEEPVSRILRAEFADSSSGTACIVGTAGRAAPARAALINGTTSHAMDYDDVQMLIGHPSTVIVPAALALAQERGASEDEFLRAVVAGTDAARFVGSLVMPAHYDSGFHSTATVGAFGAAVASGVLMQLDEEKLACAVGLAATQAAGLKCMFGTMAKPFHAGRAASAGVDAARLAARGMTAERHSLEAAQGFLATQAGQGIPPGWSAPRYGEGLREMLFKFHASCYLTHPAIEATRALKERHGLSAASMHRIRVRVPASFLSVCAIDEPSTGLEVKFSLRHMVAMTIAGLDTASPVTYSDGTAREPHLVALRQRVEIAGDWPEKSSSQVTAWMNDGRELTQTSDMSIAETDTAALTRKLQAKFRSLTAPLLGVARSEELLSHIGALGTRRGLDELVRLAEIPVGNRP